MQGWAFVWPEFPRISEMNEHAFKFWRQGQLLGKLSLDRPAYHYVAVGQGGRHIRKGLPRIRRGLQKTANPRSQHQHVPISECALASVQPLAKPHQRRAGPEVRAEEDFLPVDLIAFRDALKRRVLGARHDPIGARPSRSRKRVEQGREKRRFRTEQPGPLRHPGRVGKRSRLRPAAALFELLPAAAGTAFIPADASHLYVDCGLYVSNSQYSRCIQD